MRVFKDPNVDFLTARQAKIGSLTVGSLNPNDCLNSILGNVPSLPGLCSDTFKLQIEFDGTLRLVPLLSNVYSGIVNLLTDGRVVVEGKDFQSTIYAFSLFNLLCSPIDSSSVLRGIFGILQTFGEIATGNISANYQKLLVSYTKIKLQKMETEGKLPVVLLSVAKALQASYNDAYANLNVSLKPYVDLRSYSTMDFLTALILGNRIIGQEVIVGCSLESKYWLNFIANINGQAQVAPLPDESTILGAVDTTEFPGASAFLSIGKDYLADGKSFSCGSYHWFNYGSYQQPLVHLKVPSQNLEINCATLKGFPLLGPCSKYGSFDKAANTIGSEVNKFYFQVELDPTGTQYKIGNVLYPIELEGPLIITINNIKYQWSVPKTKYGAIIAMNTTGAPITLTSPGTSSAANQPYILAPSTALCALDLISESLLEGLETQVRLTVNSTQDFVDYTKKFGDFISLNSASSCIDNTGNIAAYAQDTNLRAAPSFCKRYEKGLFNPTTNKDIQAINFNPPPYSAKVLDGSDVSISTSYLIPQNSYGRSEITETGLSYLGTGVQTTAVQHSNSLYIDQNPLQIPDLTRSSIVATTSGRFLLDNIGVITPNATLTTPGGPLPLEATRKISASTILGASNATPIIITVNADAPASGVKVTIEDVSGNTAANGTWTVTNLSPTTFSLNGSVGNGAYFTGSGSLVNHFQAMRQITSYPLMRSRNFGIWYKIYSRLGLASYSKTGGFNVVQTIPSWISPTPMTMASAKSIYADYSMPNIFPFWNDMLAAIKAGITSGINWADPYFNQAAASAVYPYVAYPSATYLANQAAINAALPGISLLLDNDFNPLNAYSMNSKGTFLVLSMFYRALQRYNVSRGNYNVREQAANSIFSALTQVNSATTPGYGSDNALCQFLQSIAVNKFNEYNHVLVNFTQTNGVWTQNAALTTNDQWQIFINRMTFPNGFNGAQQMDIANPTQPIDAQTPQSLIMAALVDALVDIGQLNNSWTLSYVNADASVTEVASTATTLLEKASRTWGSVNTIIFPYDLDSTGVNYRQYPISYGQERMFGTQLFQYYDGGNFSAIPPPLSQKPSALGSNTNFGNLVGVLNATVTANRIFQCTVPGNGPNPLYKTGYMKQGGGSGMQRFVEGICSTAPLVEHKYSVWGSADPITGAAYRLAIRYIQTDTYPTTGDATPSQFTFDTKNYNQAVFNTGVKAKAGAVSDGLV